MAWQVRFGERSTPAQHDRGDNGVWLRRHWLHGGAEASPERLAEGLEALGLRRVYPFLGPMDDAGWPGWRGEGGALVRYEPRTARAFFEELHQAAPEVEILPWTGGGLRRDVRLADTTQRAGFAAHAALLTELGADGVHLDVEPLPDGTQAFLDLLRATKAAIGADKKLSVAAYPPSTPLHPVAEVHWSLDYTRQVCEVADELVFMAYDTGARRGLVYETQVAVWTRSLARALPPPGAGGCTWSMGVPTHDEPVAWHDPQVESLGRALVGVRRGLGDRPVPAAFRGVTLYASWTTSRAEWATYESLWRGRSEGARGLPDGGDGT